MGCDVDSRCANQRAKPDDRRPLPQHEPKYAVVIRAEHQTHGDLLAAPNHGTGNNTIQSHRREQNGPERKALLQSGSGPLLTKRIVEDLFHWSLLTHGDSRVDV